MKKILAASLVASISSIVAGAPQANAFTLTSIGQWTGFSGVTEANGNVDGVGSDTLSWGFPYPAGGEKSSFKFEGVNTTVATSPGSGAFPADLKLGTFTHNNNPILRYAPGTNIRSPISGATLKVWFGFNDPGNNDWIEFDLKHKETANQKPCEFPGVGICPDTVNFKYLGASRTSGSFTDTNGSLVNWSLQDFFNTTGNGTGAVYADAPGGLQFITDEPGSKKAYLNIEGNYRAQEVPLETDIAGVALVTGLGYLGYRRRKAGKQVIAD